MTNFDPERALEKGAVTEHGLEVEIIRTDLRYNATPILGLITDTNGRETSQQWPINGIHKTRPELTLKNKPRRATDTCYLVPDRSDCITISGCRTSLSTHRLDITLEDGEPVDATIIDLREGE